MKKIILKKMLEFLSVHLKEKMHLKLLGLMIMICSSAFSSTSIRENEINLNGSDKLIQKLTITGAIKDNAGIPLLGASILEKGT